MNYALHLLSAVILCFMPTKLCIVASSPSYFLR